MDRKKFFDGYRKFFDSDHKLEQSQVDDIDSFLDVYEKNINVFDLKTQWAYIFATVFHETNGTFKPVKEAYWLSESWRKTHLKYYPYYGRGFVQITWEDNYKKFQDFLGVDLVDSPDLALCLENALKIAEIGMKKGEFTGVKLSDYVNENETDFYNARRVINGLDKAELIESYAEHFLNIL